MIRNREEKESVFYQISSYFLSINSSFKKSVQLFIVDPLKDLDRRTYKNIKIINGVMLNTSIVDINYKNIIHILKSQYNYFYDLFYKNNVRKHEIKTLSFYEIYPLIKNCYDFKKYFTDDGDFIIPGSLIFESFSDMDFDVSSSESISDKGEYVDLLSIYEDTEALNDFKVKENQKICVNVLNTADKFIINKNDESKDNIYTLSNNSFFMSSDEND